MNAELSMAALPSPVMSRAPSNSVAVPCVFTGEEHAATTDRTGTMSRHFSRSIRNLLQFGMKNLEFAMRERRPNSKFTIPNFKRQKT